MRKTVTTRAKSDKGRHSAQTILDAAEQVLIHKGYSNLSLRKVAEKAGQTLGSLQYYYPNKDALIAAMLDTAIGRYLDMFEQIRRDAGDDPESQFVHLIEGITFDLNDCFTTLFFPELWSMANHDQQATKLMDKMYGRYRNVLQEVITLMNPKLSDVQVERLALFISASLEGHTVFIGHGKPWKKETANIAKMATQSFVWLIQKGQIPRD